MLARLRIRDRKINVKKMKYFKRYYQKFKKTFLIVLELCADEDCVRSQSIYCTLSIYWIWILMILK